jgi:hypothetical protein
MWRDELLKDSVGRLACFDSLAGSMLTGDGHGQSKEAACDAQEKLETRQGKRQEGGKAHEAEKEEVQGPANRHACSEIHR